MRRQLREKRYLIAYHCVRVVSDKNVVIASDDEFRDNAVSGGEKPSSRHERQAGKARQRQR